MTRYWAQRWTEFDLLPQLVDDYIEPAALVSILGPPDRLQQFPGREDPVRMRHHVAKEVVLLRRQMRRPSRSRHPPCGEIDVDLPEEDWRVERQRFLKRGTAARSKTVETGGG